MGQCQQSSESPMPAVPLTAAIRTSAVRSTQQPLRGSQREYALHQPPAAAAAERSLDSQSKCASDSYSIHVATGLSCQAA